MKQLKYTILIFTLNIISIHSYLLAQDNGYTLLTDTIVLENTVAGSVPLIIQENNLNHRIVEAKVYASVTPKSSRFIYQNPTATPQAVFSLNYGSNSPYTISIGGSVAGQFVVEEMPFAGGNTLANFNDIEISNITLDPALSLKVWYEIYIGVEVSTTNSITINSLEQNRNLEGDSLKSITLRWTDSNDHPNYQIQILKLENENALVLDEYQSIEVNFDDDWESALTLTTDGQVDSLRVTIGEGTGFYMARIRPIGTFNEGGISDFRNYGSWNSTPSGVQTLNRTNLDNKTIFFVDPDEDHNWIYNRIFTEHSRIKENYTIADPLLNVRQSQTNLPSQGKILITESQLDYAGRPSMSALPVPITNEDGLTFKNQFFKPNNSPDSLYRPEHFDADNKLYDPTKVDDAEEGYIYYSQSNPDQRIPSAEGYPYSRSLYERDPTNRIKEQSGVGKVHMLDDTQTDESGRTVRTYYGTAAESELVRIFGDEAPRANSVSKTVVLDQNNVAQAQYSNLQGKILATALVEEVDDYDSDNLLDLNHHTGNITYTVTDTLDANIYENDGIFSSKRFVLLQASPFSFAYSLDCTELALACHDVEIDCKWDLRVRLLNVHDPSFNTYLDTFELQNIDCVDGQKTVSYTHPNNIPSGTYIIEKKLFRANAIEVDVQDAQDKVASQINPITNKIQTELENICTPSDINDFYTFIRDFATDLNDVADNPTPIANDNFKTTYGINNPDFEITSSHEIVVLPATGDPTTLFISSQCCVNIKVDVAYVPPFRCPDDYSFTLGGNQQLDVNPDFLNSEWPVDFEGYAINFLATKCSYTANQFYQYMEGWDSGEFNWMVYHMLTDQYNCNGPQSTENLQPSSGNPPASGDDCLSQGIGGIGITCNQTNCTQYDCEQLFNCWQSILNIFVERACNDMSDLYDKTNTNSTISDAYDDENEDPSGDDQNAHIDDNISGFMKFVMWLTGASKKMRKEQQKAAEIGAGENWGAQTLNINLVKEFLDCTGYRFADILLTNSFQPLQQDVINHNNIAGIDQINLPATLSDSWSPNDPYDNTRELFPKIPNNIFAFKYFYYDGHDNDEGLISIELQTCYNDPNKCFDNGVEVPCCPNLNPEQLCEFCDLGIIECEVTHEDWSCGQRLTFYEMIKYYRNDTNEPVDLELINCQDSQQEIEEYLFQTVGGMQNQCNTACESKRSIFRNELLRVLQARCYNIGECRGANETANIPWEDIDAMVDTLVKQCKSQCPITTFACVTGRQCITTEKAFELNPAFELRDEIIIGVGGKDTDTCPGTITFSDGNEIELKNCTNFTSFSYCDLTEWEQAIGWTLELEIDSQCPAGSEGSTPAFQCLNDTDHFCVERDVQTAVYSPYGEPVTGLKDSTETKILTITAN